MDRIINNLSIQIPDQHHCILNQPLLRLVFLRAAPTIHMRKSLKVTRIWRCWLSNEQTLSQDCVQFLFHCELKTVELSGIRSCMAPRPSRETSHFYNVLSLLLTLTCTLAVMLKVVRQQISASSSSHIRPQRIRGVGTMESSLRLKQKSRRKSYKWLTMLNLCLSNLYGSSETCFQWTGVQW